jgi:hypothetical protein
MLVLFAGYLSGNVGPPSSITAAAAAAASFSPAAYVDYKRLGGEPSIAVDRYPFANNTYKDLTYISSPQGFVYPHFSPFWKSEDLGQSFRVPHHVPSHGINVGTGGGGGDSHVAVGSATHSVFFVDLPAECVTMNISRNLGEDFTSDQLGCGLNPGGIDDRPWTDSDEGVSGTNATCLAAFTCGNVYVSFINFSDAVAPTLALARSTMDGATGSFLTSPCNLLTNSTNTTIPFPTLPSPDSTPTACPDPSDDRLQIAGPVVADKSTHRVYIPFVRGGVSPTGQILVTPPWDLWVAISGDGGLTWIRKKVADLGFHNPINLFPDLTVDKAGNLYFTWSQTAGDSTGSDLGGRTDVYYTFSTDGGLTWHAPIQETSGTTAVMPWIVAGDSGKVDLVWYQSRNATTNPNLAPPDSEWNVFFSQSLNALTPGTFGTPQTLNSHANHYGPICTSGIGCGSSNRNLLDFFTVDVDHQGAAEVVWADDNNQRNDTRNFFVRQLHGPGVFYPVVSVDWPASGNTVTDPAGDVYTAAGLAANSCPGMDLLKMVISRNDNELSAALTLNGPPTIVNAKACSGDVATTGGIWGAEFWARISSTPQTGARSNSYYTGDNFYLAYRDNPPDGPSAGEAGRVNSRNTFNTTNEFHREASARATYTCTPPAGPCTLLISADLDDLGIQHCANLDSLTGLATYQAGSGMRITGTRVIPGYSEQADATAPLYPVGCVTPPAPPPPCREADGNGQFQGAQSADFTFDGDGCKDGDRDTVQSRNRGDGKDFISTQFLSVEFNDQTHTVTVVGTGLTGGVPVAFVFVALESAPGAPGWVSLQLSDGFANAGNLLIGSVVLH